MAKELNKDTAFKMKGWSPFTKTIDVKGLKYTPPNTSKIKTGSFFEGSGGKGSHKFVAGGNIGYSGKYGDISLKPGFISEKGPYHSFKKGDLKLGFSTTFGKLKKLFTK
tara:strand:- start:84 stop:410 length:327 start_codon:yes stop_codon:yes gene_type:complete